MGMEKNTTTEAPGAAARRQQLADRMDEVMAAFNAITATFRDVEPDTLDAMVAARRALDTLNERAQAEAAR